MDSLLSEFDTVSFVDPTCYANTKHLLQQREYLANQPLIIDFEGVWDNEDSIDEEDQEVSGCLSNINFNGKRRFSSEFNLYNPPQQELPEFNNNNNNNNNNSFININISSSFKPFIPKIDERDEENLNNSNNNSCIDNVNNNVNSNNNLNNISIEKIKNRIESLQKSGHIKIPKVINSTSNLQKRKTFTNKRNSLISISKTMKKNLIKTLEILP